MRRNDLSEQFETITRLVETVRAAVDALPDEHKILRQQLTNLFSHLDDFYGRYSQLERRSPERASRLEMTNQALFEANERLRIMFESIKDYAVFTIDLDNRIVSWNTGAERVFGWTEAEAVGQSGAVIFTPEDRERGEVEKECRQALEHGYAEDKRWHLRKDGSRFFASGTLRQLRDRDGVLRGFIKVARDATVELERQQAQERLRESEEHFRELAEVSPLAILVNLGGRYVYANAAAARLFGAEDTQEIVGRSPFEMIEPEYHNLVRERIRLVLEERRTTPLIEYRWKRLDGSSVDVEVAAGPTNWHGQLAVQVVAHDISDRKRAEERLRASEEKYRTLFDSIDEGFCIVEMLPGAGDTLVDYRFIEVNRSFEKMTGLKNSVGKTALELVPELESFWVETYGKVAQTGKAVRFEHVSIPMGRWFDVYASRILGTGGRQVAIVFHDITERKQAEAQLRALEERRLMAVEASGVGDWETDLVNGTVFWSGRTYELFGISPTITPDDNLIRSLIHPDDRHVLFDARTAAITKVGSPRYQVQFRVLHANQVPRWLEVRDRIIFEDTAQGRQAARIMGTIIDITAQKQVETSEREARLLAETLRDTAAALSSTLKLEEVLERAVRAARLLVVYDAAYVVLGDSGAVTSFQGDGLTEKERSDLEYWHQQLTRMEAAPLYKLAAEAGQPVLVNNGKRGKGFPLPVASARTLLVVPLVSENAVIGYLTFINRNQNRFGQGDIPKLEAFAYQVVAAINNARHFLQAQEWAAVQERQQLARDLHDAVSQTLYAASTMMESVPRLQERNPQRVPQILGDVNRLVKAAQAEMRALLLALRPANVPLTAFTELLQQLTTAIHGRKHMEIILEFEGEPVLPPQVHLALYRIAQEALNNVTKHSRATATWVIGRGGDGFIELLIRDNGRGFSSEAPSPGMGLQTMQERASQIQALLEIRSGVGTGTTVHVVWPRTEMPRFHQV